MNENRGGYIYTIIKIASALYICCSELSVLRRLRKLEKAWVRCGGQRINARARTHRRDVMPLYQVRMLRASKAFSTATTRHQDRHLDCVPSTNCVQSVLRAARCCPGRQGNILNNYYFTLKYKFKKKKKL